MNTDIKRTSITKDFSLYEQDYNLWIETMIAQIKEHNFESVDWENVLEELESLGKSDKRELRNRLTVLIEHLLKLSYWEAEREANARGWKNTIKEQRRQIKILLTDSPSLKPYLLEIFLECYADAREDAADNTGLSMDTFPSEPLFTLEEALNPHYLPIY